MIRLGFWVASGVIDQILKIYGGSSGAIWGRAYAQKLDFANSTINRSDCDFAVRILLVFWAYLSASCGDLSGVENLFGRIMPKCVEAFSASLWRPFVKNLFGKMMS